jgi:Rha family phage regulatory protein
MHELTPGCDPSTLTMSSREIADLTGKGHRNVMRDIRVMLEELYGEGGMLKFEHTHTNPQNGQTYPIYRLPRRESLILVSGYNLTMRAKIIDRWQELEAAARQPIIDPMKMLNDPKAMRDILLAYTERVIALEDKINLLAPKAAALDRITADPDSLTITQAAKALGITVKRLTTWLHAHGWIYRQNGSWLSHSRRITSGDMVYKEARYTNADTGDECLKPYCHLTPKGFTKLAALIKQEAA